MVTHKTNIANAFGKDAGDMQEGEAFVYKVSGSGPATFAGARQAGRLECESVK